MKKLLTIVASLLLLSEMNAQTSVPTSWDCSSGTPPTGWTFNDLGGTGGTNYTGPASCDGSSSLRLNLDEESLVIFFGEQPGTFSYLINGNYASDTAVWVGTFTIDESVDGVNWTNIKTYTTGGELMVGNGDCLNESYNFQNPNSRYLRFYYANKEPNFNIRLDEISIAEPIITAATIAVNANGITVLDGGVAPPFGGNSVTYTITNEGTEETLEISGITLGGIDAGTFAVTSPSSLPASILPGASLDLVLSFNPNAGQASHTASVQIASNDASNPAFNFTIYGVNGTIATEPAQAVSNIQFPINKSYRTQIAFNGNAVASDALGGYVVVRSENGAVDSAPQDGMVYQRGQMIGDAKVVYSGRPNSDNVSIVPTYVLAGKTYHFAAFPYAGSGTFTNYLNTINSVSVTSPATMVNPTEYSTVSTSSPTFITDLKAVINPHNSIFYSNYAPIMVNLWQARDTFAVVGANTFTRVINCAYSGETKLFNNPFDWTGTGYSREHTFPHSWMPSFPADNPEQPEYNDYHNLYPARQTNVNDIRCNYPFGEVVTVEVNFLEGTLGLDASGRRVYEPRDQHKGRAARALMYMATCYNGPAATFNFNNPVGKQCLNTPISYPQDQNVIKKWHFQYPPDGFDVSRNDFLDSVQTNRNPFVDQPDYACYIDFLTMSKVDNPATPCYDTTTSVNQAVNMHLSVFPNPTNGAFRISWMGNGETLELQILDMTGRVVMHRREASGNGVNIIDLNADTLPKGIYRVQLNGAKNSAGIPFVVN
jgi:hypothetical protein